jgi:glycerate dehydrogenase
VTQWQCCGNECREKVRKAPIPEAWCVAKIVVIDGYTLNPGDNPWTPLEKLGTVEVHDHTAPEDVAAHARRAEILIVNKCAVPAETIERLPVLKFISVTATGFNIVDVAAARRRGIPVSNVPEYGTQTVAQFTWALILELCHHVGQHVESVAAGDWAKSLDFCYWLAPQVELSGKRLGLVGYGRIARQVAKIGRAFGMQIIAAGRPDIPAPIGEDLQWLSTEKVFSAADVVSLHCPLTAQTEKMVNRPLLEHLRQDSFLVNTSRGGLVDEQALADALIAGQLAGAAVDVVSTEPIRPDNPLLTAPNCLITPHIAWTSLAARQRLIRVTAENVAAFIAGRPINVVN